MKTTILTVTAGLLMLGGLAWAQMEPGKDSGKRGMMGGMMGKMMPNMMGNMMRSTAQNDVSFIQGLLQQREPLNLTSEQVQQFQGLANETRKALIRQRAEIQVAELDLEALMQAETVDLAQVKDAAQRLESQSTEMRLTRLNAIANAKAMLTPEQRQQVSMQTVSMSQDMPGTMGCSMMGKMMGQQSGS